MRRSCLLLILFLSGLGGCAYGLNAIPEDLKEGLSPGVVFQEVIREPESAIGKRVLWGGVILKTTVFEGRTVIEVIQKPLDRTERPLQTDQSEGRFLVEQTGKFLDPAIYAEGREVTVIGELTKEVKKQIGEMAYRYPYVVVSFIHLWNPRPETVRPFYPPQFYCGMPYWTGCSYTFGPRPNFYLNPYGPYPYGLRPYPPRFLFRHHLH